MTETSQPSGLMATVQAIVAPLLRLTLSQVLMTRLALLFINVATGIITARALKPAGRGELAAIIIGPLFFSGVTTLGLPTALIFHLRRRSADERSLVGAALVLSGVTGLMTAVAGWWLMPIWLSQHPAGVVAMAQLFVFATPISSLVLTGRAAWEAQGRFRASALSLGSSSLLTLVTLLSLAWAGNLTPTTAACAYVLPGLVPLAWILGSLWSTYRPHWQGFGGVSRQLLAYGTRSYGADLCGTLAQYTDQALVVSFLRPEAMGMYVVALSLSRILNLLHSSVVMMQFPRLVGLPAPQVLASISKTARVSTLASVGAGVCMAALGPSLLVLVYGPAYREGALLLAILICEVIVGGVTQVLEQALLVFDRPGVATMIQVVGLGASIPLLLVLVPSLGLEGAGLSLLASTTLRFVMSVAAYPLILGFEVPRLWVSRAEFGEVAQQAGARWQAYRSAGVQAG